MEYFSFISLLVSMGAFLFSLCQFLLERQRQRRVSTIHAFDELEEKVFSNPEYLEADFLAILRHKKEVENDLSIDANRDKYIKEWDKTTYYLSLIEHFAVGVNLNIYDIHTLKRMARSHIIGEYEKLSEIIMYKRRNKGNDDLYKEFERLKRRME